LSAPVISTTRPPDRWPAAPLMLVTDRRRATADLVEPISKALDGGVNLVQIREKDMPAGELLALARRLRGITAGRALLLVNDRADVAHLCGADGVHLGEDGLPTSAARSWLPSTMLVGRSVHSVAAARQAELDGADYLIAGMLFPSRSHPERPAAGISLLEEIVRRVKIPVLGIGGIGPAEATQCCQAGAAGVAVIDAILGAPDPELAAAALLRSIREGR
jgi:thiamine-phosphate pyrophosphorylase